MSVWKVVSSTTSSNRGAAGGEDFAELLEGAAGLVSMSAPGAT